jgi:integrase/recombinase XerC
MSPRVDLAEVPELFEAWLAGRPLADRSRREYARNVRAYCGWLAVTPDGDGWQGDPLSDALARDHAARDFRRYLRVEKRAAASTVNLALASLDALYRCLELGRPNVRREKPAQAAPRALDEAAQRRLLRAAESAPIRSRSLVMLMLFTALRIGECVALDLDDVRITARKAAPTRPLMRGLIAWRREESPDRARRSLLLSAKAEAPTAAAPCAQEEN